jgi:hypothetical protein
LDRRERELPGGIGNRRESRIVYRGRPDARHEHRKRIDIEAKRPEAKISGLA